MGEDFLGSGRIAAKEMHRGWIWVKGELAKGRLTEKWYFGGKGTERKVLYPRTIFRKQGVRRGNDKVR